MCQLLGMNCNVPTDICFSFAGFRARGGQTDHHRDGWGIAFFEGKGVRLFVDAQSAYTSPIAELVKSYPIRSTNVIAHIRRATQGNVSLDNTHPFQRELWGRYWIFAHNGNLLDYRPTLNGRYHPVGNTDSETAFCHIMQEFARRFGDQMPEPEALFATLRELCIEISAYGEFNFLLSNGDFLFAHSSSRLSWITRKAPFTTAQLKDEDLHVDFSKLTTPMDCIAVIATTPLTNNENWHSLPAGHLYAFRNGEMQQLSPNDTVLRQPSAATADAAARGDCTQLTTVQPCLA